MDAKRFLQKLIPYNNRRKYKRYKRKILNWIKKSSKEKTTLEDIEELLTKDLRISKGDNLIVSSSFGNLNADYSPKELIELLQCIVGKEGNIVMPFYPPGNSYEWAESGMIFDMKHTKSSMGILTQVFSEMPGVYKSKHPTKAVVAWGKNAKEIVIGHENAKTPFYWDSPYGWLLKHPSKSLGLGVSNRPIIHACQDILYGDYLNLYKNKSYALSIKDYDGKLITINTLIHDSNKMKSLKVIDTFLSSLELDSLVIRDFGYSLIYVFSTQELLNKMASAAKLGKKI